MKRVSAALVAAVVVGLAVPSAAPAQGSENLVQTAQDAGSFKTLVKLVKSAGLASTLSGSTKYTVFAPTDAAFAKVPKSTLSALANDKAALRRVLLYHVVAGVVPARSVIRVRSVKTVEGSRVRIRVRRVRIGVRRTGVFLNGYSRVIRTNVRASNGIIHVINRVLIPPPAPRFTG